MKLLNLEGKKEQFFLAWTIQRPAPPPKVIISLFQNGTLPARPCVEEGERVLTGQKIAEPSSARGTAVHASISGKVSRIFQAAHALGGKAPAIEIVSDGLDEKAPGTGVENPEAEKTPKEKLLKIFRESGLVDMSAAMKPVHAALTEKNPRTLVLNACEPEPYLASDYVLMMSHPVEILKGAEILRTAAGAEKILFVTGDDQREGAELLKSKIYFLKWQHAEVRMLPVGYPDHEQVLLKRLKENSAAVLNLATAFAAYEAVFLHKPVIERVLTVAGECVIEPRNVWARNGSEAAFLVKTAKGFMREPRKLLIGGPLSGHAQTRLEIPVMKGSKCILALPAEIAKPAEAEACVRCGKCIEVCPAGISPVMITLAAENDLFKIAEDYGADFCIDCGNCSYICPAKRPMTELMRYAATHVSSRKDL